MKAVTQIDAAGGLTLENINTLIKDEQPVVLKGLCAKWPLAQQADNHQAIAYLSECYQGAPIGAFVADKSTRGRYFYNKSGDGFNFERYRVDLNDVFKRLLDPNNDLHLYVGSANVHQVFPKLAEHHAIDVLTSLGATGSVWLGNQSRISAHHDLPHNIACNLIGTRRFTLFAPEQVENLYIGSLDLTPAGQAISLVDFESPDFSQHPKFKVALEQGFSCELDPGDGLFVPSLWWHHVEGLSSFNLMMNFWWHQVPSHSGAPMDALRHALMNIGGLSDVQKQHFKTLFDYYVFNTDPEMFSHVPEAQKGVLNPHDEISARKLRAELLNKLNR